MNASISIHAPIVGCDKTCTTSFIKKYLFQSTHPSWGATMKLTRTIFRIRNFNPRTHRGVRQCNIIIFLAHFDISIHAPIVGCDFSVFRLLNCPRNFNPRTHRGVRLYIRHQQAQNQYISIHAPIVGCDREEMREELYVPISIHAPIVGCDNTVPESTSLLKEFQSTHPSWGATSDSAIPLNSIIFQSTHPSWGAT